MWKNWTETILTIAMLIALVVLILLITGIWKPASADGYADGTEKGASFTSVPLRAPSRYPCHPGLTQRQCRIINGQAELQLRRRRGRAPYSAAYAEAGPRRAYVERERDYHARRPNRPACGDLVVAEGKKMWLISGIGAARREARLQWEREVVSKLGERYSDPSYARKSGGDGFTCWRAGSSNRCSFSARPCRAE